MKLFKWGKAPVSESVVETVQSVEVQPVAPVFSSITNKDRKGMWVMTERGVGVVVSPNLVELAKPDGTRKMVLNDKDEAVVDTVEVSEYVQAFIEDIPPSRVGGDYGVFYALGYKHKDQA